MATFKFPDWARMSLRQIRNDMSEMSGKELADALKIAAPHISRIERKIGGLETMSLGALRKYLAGVGYELRLVAVPIPASSASKWADIIEIVDATEADET